MKDDEMKIIILVPERLVAAIKTLAAGERRSMKQEMMRAFAEHILRHDGKEATKKE